MEEAEDLTLQAAQLSLLTRGLSHCCTVKEQELFHRFGLTAAEGQMLLLVAEREPVLPSVVAESMGVTRSRITPLAQRLWEKGYLVRHQGDLDRRTRRMVLSGNGRQLADIAMQFQLRFHMHLLSEFCDEDRERLMAVLSDLNQRMVQARKAMRSLTVEEIVSEHDEA